jgi:hypothetical protein
MIAVFPFSNILEQLIGSSILNYIRLSHEGQNPPFLGCCLQAVKDSRQFKQREKRLLKVVTVNLPLYKQL